MHLKPCRLSCHYSSYKERVIWGLLIKVCEKNSLPADYHFQHHTPQHPVALLWSWWAGLTIKTSLATCLLLWYTRSKFRTGKCTCLSIKIIYINLSLLQSDVDHLKITAFYSPPYCFIHSSSVITSFLCTFICHKFFVFFIVQA